MGREQLGRAMDMDADIDLSVGGGGHPDLIAPSKSPAPIELRSLSFLTDPKDESTLDRTGANPRSRSARRLK